jgi:AraC-like DNA-binding protein/quercetin dioxygenase-like cupin family protein
VSYNEAYILLQTRICTIINLTSEYRGLKMYPLYYLENPDNFRFDLSIHEITANIVPHGHSFLELHYVFEGNGVEIINGHRYTMKPGTFAVIYPHQIHEMHIQNNTKVLLYNLCIPIKTFFEHDESGLAINKLLFAIDLNPITIYDMDESTSKEVHTIISEMLTEFNSKKIWKDLMFKSKLIELIILFDRYRRFLAIDETKNLQSTGRNDIWSIIHYVYKNFHENITLNNLSQLFYLSIPYISTSFKQCLGINFHIFLRNLRIEKACSLLTSSNMSVTAIAYDVGYTSYSTFVRVFHICKGISPALYRKLK